MFLLSKRATGWFENKSVSKSQECKQVPGDLSSVPIKHPRCKDILPEKLCLLDALLRPNQTSIHSSKDDCDSHAVQFRFLYIA